MIKRIDADYLTDIIISDVNDQPSGMSNYELKLLKRFTIKECKKQCGKKGRCDDCYICYQQVFAIDHLKREYFKLLKENKKLQRKLERRNKK